MGTNTISVQQYYVKLVWVQIKMLNRHDILIINRLIIIDSFSINRMRLLVYYIVIYLLNTITRYTYYLFKTIRAKPNYILHIL